MAPTQEVGHICRGHDTTDAITRAELVRVQARLETFLKEDLLHELLCTARAVSSDSQVTLSSTQKAINQLKSTWLNASTPLINDIVTCLIRFMKSLTDACHTSTWEK